MLCAFNSFVSSDKPKFDNDMNYVELNEHDSYHLHVPIRSNPSVDNLMFGRIKDLKAIENAINNNNRIPSSSLSSDLIFNQPSIMKSKTNELISMDLQWSSLSSRAKDFFINSDRNESWPLESIPNSWTWKLSNDNRSILFDIHNVSVEDYGLYQARISNTIGDSSLFIRLVVRGNYKMIVSGPFVLREFLETVNQI